MAVTLVGTTLVYGAVSVAGHWSLRVLLAALAVGISGYILHFDTLRRKE